MAKTSGGSASSAGKLSSPPLVAAATVFVSHAWRYRACDVVAAMLAYDERQPKDTPPTYFWFDLFVNDQHDALTLPQLWWRDSFTKGIERIGHTLLVLSPWTDPIPLTRIRTAGLQPRPVAAHPPPYVCIPTPFFLCFVRRPCVL